MLVFTEIKKIKSYLLSQSGTTTGFVPTMGALHDGHLSLVKASKLQSDITVCSIFVNPVQFNKKEDLDNYPRNFEDDMKKLEGAGCDVLFLPSVSEMYPEKVDKIFEFGRLAEVMEGEKRPGHFNGVGVVIERLFDVIQPEVAFFGEKDFQQLAVVRELTRQLNFKTTIVGCPIVREKSGLAMSSRNERLSPVEREVSTEIYQSLLFVKENYKKYSLEELKELARERINNHKELVTEYFEIADGNTLEPVDTDTEESYVVAFAAVIVGSVRLIDNMTIIN